MIQSTQTGIDPALAALHRSMAVIEFKPDGTILSANDNFLAAVGYRLDEVVGQHHRIFMAADERESEEYREFWARLARGEFFSDEFKRVCKDGTDIWIQATYNPMLDADGKVFRIVKFATDITERVRTAADRAGQIDAIGKSQAVIAFDLQGNILEANANFLAATGYRLDELVGRHHRIFVPEDYAVSAEYAAFWSALARGEFKSGEFRRVRKNGDDLWIQATYNPILDRTGRPFKVVKFATDITAEKTQLLAYKSEMASLTEAAGRGNLSHRADLAVLDGMFAEMAGQVNLLIDTIVAPIGVIRAALGDMARGDLTVRIHEDFEGDHAVLKDAVHATLDALNDILLEVRTAANEMGSGAHEVSSASQTLSHGAVRQSAAVEQMSAAMTTIAQQVQSTAGGSKQAAALASQARQFAKKGDTRMASMLEAMSAIRESSDNIASIIKVIDEIAFQTNLLALNAAVEAARAGAQGKGFAVVAEEVRNLAARSASAARETTAYIETSLSRVESGSRLAKDTATSLEDIVGAVDKVVDLVSNIAQASQQQALELGQIEANLSDVSRITQANSASAEETATASEQLSGQATGLQEKLQRFHLRQPPMKAGGLTNLDPHLMAALQAYLRTHEAARAR